MAFNIYEINKEITVNFRSFCAVTGITDLEMVVTNPNDASASPVTLTEIGNGLYETSFTPTIKGRYYIKISSASQPKNGYAESYYVDEIPTIIVDAQNINRLAGNVIITDESGSGDTAEITTDGFGVKRLAVDANFTVPPTVSLTEFTPYFNYSVANTVLSDVSYTTLIDLTGKNGRLAFININGSRSDYTVRLSVDGTIRLTIPMINLGSDLGLTATSGTSIPIYTTLANKNFLYNPLVPIDFTDGFKVEAIKTSTQQVVINWMITYRESV